MHAVSRGFAYYFASTHDLSADIYVGVRPKYTLTSIILKYLSSHESKVFYSKVVVPGSRRSERKRKGRNVEVVEWSKVMGGARAGREPRPSAPRSGYNTIIAQVGMEASTRTCIKCCVYIQPGSKMSPIQNVSRTYSLKNSTRIRARLFLVWVRLPASRNPISRGVR